MAKSKMPPQQPLCEGCTRYEGGACPLFINATASNPSAVISSCTAYSPPAPTPTSKESK